MPMRISTVNARSGAGEDRGALPPRKQCVFVGTSHVARRLGPCELPRAVEAAARAGCAQIGVVGQAFQSSRQALCIVGIDQQSRISDDFGQRPAVRDDDRHACRHRFERRYPESFVEGRQHECLRALEQSFAFLRRDVAAVLDMAGERRLIRSQRALAPASASARPAMTSRGTLARRASSRAYASSSPPTFLRGSIVPTNSR